MRRAKVYNFGIHAGYLAEMEKGRKYIFSYINSYGGPPVSQTLPVEQKEFEFNNFPPFFEGLLPEGMQLEALLRKMKIDRNDFFDILISTGNDLVGSVTVKESE